MVEKYLEVLPDNIPQLLKDLKQWLVWKPIKDEKGKKNKKIPFSMQKNPATGIIELTTAKWMDPDTWMDFNTALKTLQEHKECKGLQFVLPTQEQAKVLGSPCVVGVDFDNITSESASNPDHSKLDYKNATFDEGKLQEIRSLNTYAELSPSGHGLRALLLGEFPVDEETHRNNVEVYQFGKLLTITGHTLDGVPENVNAAQDALTALRAKYFKKIITQYNEDAPKTLVKFTDSEVIEKLINQKCNSPEKSLANLFAEKPDSTEFLKAYNDDKSAADISLVSKISFYTQDEDQIDGIFRKSALFRPGKWDETHGHLNGEPVTYGQRTIKRVLLTQKCVFNGTSCDISGIDLYPFKVTAEGIIKEEQSKHGPFDKLITSSPCMIVGMGVNIDRHNEILYKLKIKNIRNEEKFVWKTTKELLEKAEVLKLHVDDLQFKESNATDLVDFFDKYITASKGQLPVENAVSTGGWKNNFSMYVIGNRAITNNEVREILPIDNPTAENYAVAGTLENWVKGANCILNYDAVRFKMYNACAATLLRLLHMPSYLLDQHVRTGQLKSDSSELVASMFGNPLSQQTAGNSTTVGVLGLITYCVDIPTFIDETSQNTEAVRKLAYSIGNVGKRVKGRNDNKQGIIIPSEFTTVLEMTGENPIIPENANGGEDVRILPLTEGVSDVLSQEDITGMKMLIEENYGQVIELYIQELLSLKDQLKDMYKANFNSLPSVTGISENRVKKQYAVAATAGEILERVFLKIGDIEPKNHVYICSKYFNLNVVENGFTPDHLKILRSVYTWYMANRIYFEDPETSVKEVNHESLGCVKVIDEKSVICFFENSLKNFINKEFGQGKYETALKEWKDQGILLTTTKNQKTATGEYRVKTLKTREIRFGGSKIYVIAIPQEKFYEYLNVTEDEQQKAPEDKDDTDQLPQNVKPSIPANDPYKGISVETGSDVETANALLSEGLL